MSVVGFGLDLMGIDLQLKAIYPVVSTLYSRAVVSSGVVSVQGASQSRGQQTLRGGRGRLEKIRH